MPPFTMATPELHTNHNVFILGAGFSADAGLPTIATFMRALREAGEHYKRSGDNQNANAIARVLEYRLRAAGAAYRCVIDPDNIEDLFSLIDTEDDSQGPGSQEDYIRQAIAATIEFSHKDYIQAPRRVRLALSSAPGVNQSVGEPGEDEHFRILHLYDAYLAAMTGMLYEPEQDRRNTIITFNYDTLVEEALASLEKSYDYGFLSEEYSDGHGGGFVRIDPQLSEAALQGSRRSRCSRVEIARLCELGVALHSVRRAEPICGGAFGMPHLRCHYESWREQNLHRAAYMA